MIYDILIHGDEVIAWAGTALAVLVARYVIAKIDNDRVREYLGRAWAEVRAAVAEVHQTYVAALKEANADGKLTPEEAKEARERAISVAKTNLGRRGLARLGRIVGVDSLDSWLSNKVEAAVDGAKRTAPAATEKPRYPLTRAARSPAVPRD